MKIAIASGKGGTGKTSLSTNMASYFAETQNVVLVDLDVEEPDSNLFFDSKLIFKQDKYYSIPKWNKDACTLCDICHKVCNYNAIIRLDNNIMVFPQLCHSCFACSELCPEDALPMINHKMGELRFFQAGLLAIVESRLDIGQEQAIPLIKQTHKFVNETFSEDIIQIFDCPPGTSCPVQEAVKPADFVILVTEPTPFGLHDLSLAVDTMQQLEKPFGVIVNRYGIGNNDVLNFCQKENITVLAKIPNSRQIAEAYSKGKLFYQEIPEVKVILKDLMTTLKKTVQKK